MVVLGREKNKQYWDAEMGMGDCSIGVDRKSLSEDMVLLLRTKKKKKKYKGLATKDIPGSENSLHKNS